MKTVALAIWCALLGSTASTASSQQLLPLEEVIDAGAEESYLFIRCAAFHFSTIEFAGTDVFDEEYVYQAASSIDHFMIRAIQIRTESENLNVAAASETLHEEAFTIANLYAERYKRNFAAGVTVFEDDSLWVSDAALCKMLIEADI